LLEVLEHHVAPTTDVEDKALPSPSPGAPTGSSARSSRRSRRCRGPVLAPADRSYARTVVLGVTREGLAVDQPGEVVGVAHVRMPVLRPPAIIAHSPSSGRSMATTAFGGA
jgi:hypothetical protein